MGTIIVNGQKFEGDNIEIRGSRVFIDGKESVAGCASPLHVIVEGGIQELKADGSVTCNNVAGNVAAGGSVTCDNVGGNIAAGGSVNCDDVRGNVAARGSVRIG